MTKKFNCDIIIYRKRYFNRPTEFKVRRFYLIAKPERKIKKMKKKILILTLALALLTTLTLIPVSATVDDDDQPPAASTFVTVSIINGTPVMAAERISVTDIDGDGKLTVNDALYCAHETAYEGGAEAGYASVESSFGLSLTKLWGDTSGAFGYYVNNASPLSLLDEIGNVNSITAFVYQDQISWTDSYSYFDKLTATVKAGESVTLNLSYLYTDYVTWETSVKLGEGAKITVNGTETDITVDMNGNATVKLNEAGVYLISATSDLNLVAPVCVVNVEANPTLNPPADNGNDVEEPQNNIGWAMPLCAAVICGAVAVSVALSKKNSSDADDGKTDAPDNKNDEK